VVSAGSAVVKDVVGQFKANKPEQPKPKVLTPKQQVDKFLSMSDADLNEIKQARGEKEYHRYMTAMLEKSKEFYNG